MECGAAFHEERHHVPRAEFGEQLGQVDAAIRARRHDGFCSPRFNGSRRFRRSDRNKRRAFRSEHGGARGEASCAVHDNAERLTAGGQRSVAHGEKGVIRERGADADHDGVSLGAEAVRLSSRGLVRYPAGVAGAGGYLAVQAHGELRDDERQPGGDVLRERLDELLRFRWAVDDGHGDARLTQALDAPASGVRSGVHHGDAHRGDARLHEGVGAGRRSAVVCAGFERDVEVSAASGVAGHAKRLGLGVGAAGWLGASLADDASVAHKHSAYGRVGAGAPNRLTGEFDSPLHVVRGGHRTTFLRGCRAFGPQE